MENKKAIMLGAGLTGLTTAWNLAKNGYDVTVIEKESHAGGLAGTIDWDGWKFDYGAHTFHPKDPEITKLYHNLLKDDFDTLKNLTIKVFIFNKLITYPLVGLHVFYVMDSMTMIKAGLDFFFTRLKSLFFGFKQTKRLDEWIITRFGQVLYDIYFSHYIERIQKKDPMFLSKDIGEKKIPIFRIRQYLRKEIFKGSDPHPDDVTAWDYYYAKGGAGALSRIICEEIVKYNGKIKFNESVKKIEVNNGEVVAIKTDKNSYKCKDCSVVSTIPLNELIRSIDNSGKEVLAAANELDYVKMRFLLMKVNRSKVMGYRWINFSDAKFPFYRVSEYSYDKFRLVPENQCSLIFELPLNKEDPLWKMDDNSLTDIILPLFNEAFTLSRNDVVSVKSLYTDNASPIMSIHYWESLKLTLDYIVSINNLYSIGRQGLFTYVNMDGCTKMGLDLAQALIDGHGKKRNMEFIKIFHNI